VSSNPHSSAFRPRASHSSALRTRRTRTALAGAAVMVALPVLAACSAGTNPEVYDIKPNNGQAQSGYMWISNVWVVADPNTGNAEVIGQVANTDPNGNDSTQLTSVTVNGAALSLQQPATTASSLAPGVLVGGGAVTIPGLKSVQFGQKGQPVLLAPDPGVIIGQTAAVVYTFGNGSTATVTAQVQPNTGLWANYNPNGTASASPSASAFGLATGTASPGASVSASVGATPSGTASPAASGTPSPSAS
jgi:hypothetical protein